MAKEFLLDNDTSDEMLDGQFRAEEEAKHLQKLSEILLNSQRLENAMDNPKAKAFFSRDPNEVEGYDRLWVSAIDNVCMKNLAGAFRNYGIEFACNFGDWENGCTDDAKQSIEDIASFKARKVFEVTGLPCVASRTSFEVEPARVQDKSTPMNRGFQNTRITSGYSFNDVGEHIDFVVDALKPYSEPTRVTRFRSCFCFYDGEMEIFDYGELDCDIHFSNSLRTFIPMSTGIDGLVKTLQLAFGLEFQGWLRKKVRDAMSGNESRVSIQLRDRILKEGKVLPNNIVDVSNFMDSMVDVNLMDACAKELSNRFEVYKPTKILTVATTGLVVAIPMAKYLQVPVVYARKERSVVMSDTYQAAYSSKTVGKNRELLVSKHHIDPEDRILIVDDFLSSGASQEALFRIVSDAGAKAVGVGVLLEKSYDAGRQSLSGFNIPVESVAKIASVNDGIITMEEEEGYSATQ
jgi:xanthine phosphoribosyltransferase